MPDEMNNNILIYGYILDGKGGATEAGPDAVNSWRPGQGVLWTHLDLTNPETAGWLKKRSGLDEIVYDALLAEETRPRCFSHQDGLVVILRGVNLNPGADAEDMVSIRMWIDKHRIISARLRHLMSIEDIRRDLENKVGPKTPGDFLAEISIRLMDRMSPTISGLDDRLDELEDELLTDKSSDLRHDLRELRREVIMLRRYLSPQREAILRLHTDKTSLIDEKNRYDLRESYDKVTRFVEDLDAIREKATIVYEEIAARLADQMNRNTYLLTIVAALFLPLGFFTGLLGINVGGIPGAENNLAFIEVSMALGVLFVIELWLLRKLKWF